MISKRAVFNLFPLFSFFLLVSLPSLSLGSDWKIQPEIEARVGYSDNIEFATSDDEESGFITQLNPGITIVKETGRLQVDLDYLMQNFYYLNGGDLDTDHELDSIARYALIPKSLYINGYANVEQVLVDNSQQIQVDNLNNTGNTTDEATLGIGPQWIQNFGGFAQTNLAYLYSIQRFDDENGQNGLVNGIDDNDRQSYLASVGNITPQDDRFDWTLSYTKDEVDFEDGDTFEFINEQIELGLQVNSVLELVGSYGYEDNDFGDNITFGDESGTFWTAGFIAGLGQFTSLEVRRGERFFGNSWFGELNVGGPKLSVTATYEEVAELEGIDDDIFSFRDSFAGGGLDNLADTVLDELDNDIDTSLSANRDSVSVSKDWDVAIAYTVSKSTFLAEISNEQEEFLDTTEVDKFERYAVGWIWRITALSALTTTFEYLEDESTDLVGVETTSDLYELEIGYVKELSPKTDFDVSYIYSDGRSEDNDDDDFTSNTASVGLVHRF